MSIVELLRTMALDPTNRNRVITLEDLQFYTERLLREVAGKDELSPNVIEAIDVNDEPAEIDPETKTAKIEVPTRVSQLEDAGSYLHIKALHRELQNYVQRGELPETILTQDEKDRLDMLPDLSQKVGPNGVSLNEDGHLELESLTPDKIDAAGFGFILDCGGPVIETAEGG